MPSSEEFLVPNISRRGFLVAAAGAVGVASAVGLGALPASAATSPVLVGSSTTDTNTETGRAIKMIRRYHHQGTAIPTTASAAGILPFLTQGLSVVYSIKVPDASAATASACAALAKDIRNHGYADVVWIVLWHEPYGDMTAAEYIARYKASAPGIRAQGIKTGVIFHTFPIWQKGLDYSTFWPGDSICDFMGIDTYPADRPGTLAQQFAFDPLETISPLTSFAKSHGKVFGVGEFGVDARDAAALPSAAKTWMSRFQNLGGSCRFLLYFDTVNGADFRLSANNNLLVPPYQAIYDHFS